MNTASIAMIFVCDAIIAASMAQPDLPDDFRKNTGTVGTVEVSAPEPTPTRSTVSVVFSKPIKASAPGLVSHDVTVTEHWLVSESWCGLCPAAKQRFLAEGHDASRIIDIATAKQMGQKWSSVINGREVEYTVPYRFTTTSTKTIQQPPSYRKEWPPKWDVEGNRNASKQFYLSHLRGNSNHKGKHWQQRHLESWSREQLAALHSDDHDNVVPTFTDPPESVVEAVVSGARGSPDLLAKVLALHLESDTTVDAPPQSGMFVIDVDVSESARHWASDLLTKRRVDFQNGITVDWSGKRSITINDGRFEITPGATVRAEKFKVSVSVSLTGISYTPDLSEVTLELSGAPDLTVRFQ